MGLICAQSALLNGLAEWAADSFTGVRNMLLFTTDCFDSSVGTQLGVGLLDLFAYLARLDPETSPYAGYEFAPSDPLPSSFVRSRPHRLLGGQSGDDITHLPPLCIDGTGLLSLSAESLPPLPAQGLYLQCKAGAHSLVPVRVRSIGNTLTFSHNIALLMRVDTASWTNLGHGLNFIVPYIFAAFFEAFSSGGLPAVWRRRERLQLYLFLPGNGQDVLRAKKHPHMLPWLTLLSPHPPIFLADPGQPSLDASLLPEPVKLASLDTNNCHSAGIWGNPAVTDAFTKTGFDLLADIARALPPWQVNREELIRRVWSRQASQGFGGDGRDGTDEDDACLKLATDCIRVLVVTRGTYAAKKRSVVNLEEALRHVQLAYPDSEVRIAVVEMEKFTLAEEVALASVTDVLVGAVGSAMWWAIFMPEGACVVWLISQLSEVRRSLLDEPSIGLVPLWRKRAMLEYGTTRNLWHIYLYGQNPPKGVQGKFEADGEEDVESLFGVLERDVYIDIKQFVDSFSGIVKYLRRRYSTNATRSTI
mmetsp:Transcript_68495/g.221822  ORF Transcript_68495/g.221822 Transcript_68495/m.221822 type:complete len:532 (-) Transcript_68495:287-1882(-)